jgi:hypothetical protein
MLVFIFANVSFFQSEKRLPDSSNPQEPVDAEEYMTGGIEKEQKSLSLLDWLKKDFATLPR